MINDDAMTIFRVPRIPNVFSRIHPQNNHPAQNHWHTGRVVSFEPDMCEIILDFY